jgi:hypothetical protein
MSESRISEWANQFYMKAKAAGDQERVRLAELAPRILQVNRQNNPQQALKLLDEAERMARALDEPCWFVVFNWMRGEVYVHSLIDMKTAVRVISEAIVEVRKPAYQGCIGIQNLYTVLLTAYIYTDPFGYGQKITDALDFIENNFDSDQTERHSIAIHRVLVELARENYEAANQYALDSLAIAGNDAFLSPTSYLMLAEVAHYRQDLHTALEYAHSGEALLHDVEHRKAELIQQLGYQMVYLIKLGQISAADAAYQRVHQLTNELEREPYYTLYECRAGYHEYKGELSLAIADSRAFIEAAERSGGIYSGCAGRVHLCRLLGKASESMDIALAEAWQSFNQLIDATPLKRKLEQIEQGDFSGDFWS